MSEKWTWGNNSFVNPEDFSFGIPVYYDAPKVNGSNYNNGIIDNNTLLYIDGVYKNALHPGSVCFKEYTSILPPAQAIDIRMATAVNYHNLTQMPDNSFLPIVKTYRFDKAINAIVPKRDYKYTPGSLYDTTTGYRFYISFPTETTAKINISGTSSVSKTETISYVAGVDGVRIFQLSEFPIRTLSITTPPATYKVNYKLGLIYTNENVDSLEVSYYSVPLIIYLPKNFESNYFLVDGSLSSDAFNYISPKHEVYL